MGSARAPRAVPGAPAGNTSAGESSAWAPKTTREGAYATQYRDGSGQTLFIDARKLGTMIDRVLRVLTAEDLEKIIGAFRTWIRSAEHADVPGFCKSATTKQFTAHGFVLTPGRYVDAEDVEDEAELFQDRWRGSALSSMHR